MRQPPTKLGVSSIHGTMVPRMVGVAQLVRAPGCGPGGRGFESPRSPHFVGRHQEIGAGNTKALWVKPRFRLVLQYITRL